MTSDPVVLTTPSSLVKIPTIIPPLFPSKIALSIINVGIGVGLMSDTADHRALADIVITAIRRSVCPRCLFTSEERGGDGLETITVLSHSFTTPPPPPLTLSLLLNLLLLRQITHPRRYPPSSLPPSPWLGPVSLLPPSLPHSFPSPIPAVIPADTGG